jgi:GNAT superfamily N-acetyltransferase
MADATSEPPAMADATNSKTEANRKKREKAKAKKAAAKAALEVRQLNLVDVLAPPGGSTLLLDTWFTAYQEAFAKEHEWMEARKQPTSRGMGMSAKQMLPLVFSDVEAGSSFSRVCFFAFKGDAIVGYATVDVDPDPSKVCHLRMLLVAPEMQRQGVGVAMLKHIVTTAMPTRDIGLKYAKCNDYHKLYSPVGFRRIGDDDFYVYMALRRPR